MRDDVAATAGWVCVDRLAVAEDHSRQQQHDRDRDGQRPEDRRGTCREQDNERFLRRVRHRRQRIGRKDRQRLLLGEPLVNLELAVDRRADQDAPQLAPGSARLLEGQAGFDASGATARKSCEFGSSDADYGVARAKTADLFDDAPIGRTLARSRGTDTSWRWGWIHCDGGLTSYLSRVMSADRVPIEASAEWRRTFPNARVGCLQMRGVSNAERHPALDQHLLELQSDLRARHAAADRVALANLPVVQAYQA